MRRTAIPLLVAVSLALAAPSAALAEVARGDSSAGEAGPGAPAERPTEGDEEAGADALPAVPAPEPAAASAEAPPPEAGSPAPTSSTEVEPAADGPALTLAEAQRIALERSPALHVVAEEIDRADAMIQQGWGYLLPSIFGQATYTMADEPTVVTFEIPGMSDLMGGGEQIVVRRQHVATLGLSVRQPLFSGRAIPLLIMAHESRDLADLSLEQARRQLSLSVARAFYATASARRTIGALERQLALAQEHVAASRARLEAQAGLAIDVARAELQVETIRSQRENAILAYHSARDALALLMAIPPDDLPRLAEPPPPEGTTESVDDLVDRAFAERIDLAVGRDQIRLAERDLQSVWMTFLPSLDLSWSLSHTLTELGGFGDRRTSWNLAIVASIPIFDGGIRYGQLRDRRARIRQAELNLEALEQSVAIEVRRAYRAWQTSITTLEISQRQLALAREAHRLALAAYAAGAASNLEVVDAQRTLASAEVELELQLLSSQLALIELLGSLEGPTGGGAAAGGGGPR